MLNALQVSSSPNEPDFSWVANYGTGWLVWMTLNTCNSNGRASAFCFELLYIIPGFTFTRNPAGLAILCTFKFGSIGMGLEAYRYGKFLRCHSDCYLLRPLVSKWQQMLIGVLPFWSMQCEVAGTARGRSSANTWRIFSLIEAKRFADC